jgi:hypothetical protein
MAIGLARPRRGVERDYGGVMGYVWRDGDMRIVTVPRAVVCKEQHKHHRPFQIPSLVDCEPNCTSKEETGAHMVAMVIPCVVDGFGITHWRCPYRVFVQVQEFVLSHPGRDMIVTCEHVGYARFRIEDAGRASPPVDIDLLNAEALAYGPPYLRIESRLSIAMSED